MSRSSLSSQDEPISPGKWPDGKGDHPEEAESLLMRGNVRLAREQGKDQGGDALRGWPSDYMNFPLRDELGFGPAHGFRPREGERSPAFTPTMDAIASPASRIGTERDEARPGEPFYGQENVDRCRPPGRDPCRGGLRQSS